MGIFVKARHEAASLVEFLVGISLTESKCGSNEIFTYDWKDRGMGSKVLTRSETVRK